MRAGEGTGQGQTQHETCDMSFRVGDQVRSRVDGRLGVIRAVGPIHGGIQFYLVFWAGAGDSRMVAETDLLPFNGSTQPSQSFVLGHFSGYQGFQRAITFQRLRRDRPLRNNVYAFNASRTRFFPYQFKPLIKFLDSPNHRILICDEVGLGKTIEAGLILTELRARHDIRAVLVVCPSNLLAKWRLELKQRFAEDFRVLHADDVVSLAEESAESGERPAINGVVSYETMRSSRVLRTIEELTPPLDLVILDESHYMRNFGTLTRRVGVALGQLADAMVLLTATPVHLGNENLFSLLQLLDEEDFPNYASAESRFRENEPVVRAQRLIGRIPPDVDRAAEAIEQAAASPWFVQHPLLARVRSDLTRYRKNGQVARADIYQLQADLAELNLIGYLFSRTRRREVNLNLAVRKPHALEIDLSAEERRFYDAVTDYVRARAQTSTEQPVVVQWRINGIQRRAASSIQALVEYYRGQYWERGSVESDSDPDTEGAEDSSSAEQDAWRDLAEIIRSWPHQATDSKYERLRKFFQDASDGIGRKIVIFAFYRDTLKYLARRLHQDHIPAVLLHGGIPPEDRQNVIARFKDDASIRVLLASRVGSEGLDFQFADTIVNYDLPWNPMEVEQRIGRIDRIGQTAPVIHILNLWTRDTIEERILRRLYERIGVFERSIGSLDAVLGTVMPAIERLLLSSTLTPAEQEAETERIAQAIENEKRQEDEIDGHAAAFVGLDDFFSEEIRRIRTHRRYVTPEQLWRFIEDFLRERAPGSRLSYDSGTKVGRLYVDRDLKRFLQESGVAGEALSLLGSSHAGMPMTFDGETANDHSELEFLSILHPLVRAVTAYYAQQGSALTTAHQVFLRTDRLPAGRYTFAVYRQTTHSVRRSSTLEAVFLDESLRLVLDGLDAEALLGEIVETGADLPRGELRLEPSWAERAIDAASRSFLDRLATLRSRIEQENQLFLERRLASLRQSYAKNIDRLERRLREGVAKERQERYLRMVRAQIARLRTELVMKEQALQALQAVQIEFEEVAAGLLQVE